MAAEPLGLRMTSLPRCRSRLIYYPKYLNLSCCAARNCGCRNHQNPFQDSGMLGKQSADDFHERIDPLETP